jgi:phosphatidylinositol alpha-1,6-mannosyltransferase
MSNLTDPPITQDSFLSGSDVISTAPYLFIFLEIFAREGGIQSYVKDIFRSYLELSDVPEADVFLLRDSQDCSNPFARDSFRFKYLKTKSPLLGRIRLAIALLMYLVQRRPQRVFCGHVNLAPLVRLLCQPLGIPYTVLTYGKEVWTALPKRYRDALYHADQIWTISRYSRDCACEANNLNPDRVQLLPCAVNGDYFTPGAKSKALLEQYRLVNHLVLMTVARLWSGDIYKGVDVTIRALPAIAQVFPEVKYLVIGRGDDQPRLTQLAKDLGVEDQVVFAGFVPTAELVEHYRLADAYVMPSQEGFGIVYLEAMACGVPVLSGDTDGSADPLQDGKLGWHVPHRDPQAVAHACIEMLKGCERIDGLPRDRRCDGAWLREQAIALFGRDALTHQLYQLLHSSV